MSDTPKPETPVVLVKGQQKDEDWHAFEQRVLAQFRAAGLLKGGKGPRPKDEDPA